MPQIVIINGSIRGAAGNTAALLALAAEHLREQVQVVDVVLADYRDDIEQLVGVLQAADGFLIGSGVYWNAYGAPLQHFIEVMTSLESTAVFLGKPASVLITMDSVGGSDVAARLLGVLNLWGCSIPPLATVVISRVALLASRISDDADVWLPGDVAVVARNLCTAVKSARVPWQAWPVHATPPLRGPYPTVKPLAADHPPWPQPWWEPR